MEHQKMGRFIQDPGIPHIFLEKLPAGFLGIDFAMQGFRPEGAAPLGSLP